MDRVAQAPSPVTVQSYDGSSVEISSSMNDTSRTIVEGEEVSTTTVAHGLGRLSEESAGKRMSHLPSPPLTRVGTDESVRRGEEREGEGQEKEKGRDAEEEAHMHPGSDLETEERDERASSFGGVERAGTASPSSAGLSGSQLRFHTKTPPSPLWDGAIQPPAPGRTRGHYYGHAKERGGVTVTYSAKEKDRFATMQSQATARSSIPKSSYYFGPPAPGSAYGSRPIGQIGLHHPREILRVERDYSGGELVQFAPIFPLELEGRVTPKQFYESITAINEILVSAHSLKHSFLDNLVNVLTLQLGQIFFTSHYDKEMRRLQQLFDYLNGELFNPVGLRLVWPRKVAFLFLEIEYY